MTSARQQFFTHRKCVLIPKCTPLSARIPDSLSLLPALYHQLHIWPPVRSWNVQLV